MGSGETLDKGLTHAPGGTEQDNTLLRLAYNLKLTQLRSSSLGGRVPNPGRSKVRSSSCDML